MSNRAASRTGARYAGYALILLAVAFNLIHLYPEVAIDVPSLNDGVLHLLGTERAAAALASGQSPADPWLGTVAMGYPLFHHYQHLGYYPPALLHLLSLGALPLEAIFTWTSYLLLSLFPMSIYGSMRRFGFGRLQAVMGGLLSSLIATGALYGFDYSSYTWGGYGLYTQLWGMVLLPPALAQGYHALRTGRGWFWAALLLAATMLAHLVLGYMAILSLGLLAILPLLGRWVADGTGRGPWAEVWRRVLRLAVLLLLVAATAAYFLVPFLLDRAYMNRSVWEEPGKYDGYGAGWVLRALVQGELFDFGRLPVLTLLVVMGLVICLWRWREERFRVPAVLFLFWLLLYCGRPTWGVLLNLLPLSQDLHLHRLISGVHLGGIFLAGIGLALPLGGALSRASAGPRRRHLVLLAAGALLAVLLAPMLLERRAYLARNAAWMEDSRAAVAAEEPELAALVARLEEAPPGRIYAGLSANWGGDYRAGAVPVYAMLQRAGFDMLGHLYHALSLNADVQVLFDESRPEHYNLFNVRYVVAPHDRVFPDFVRPVADYGRHRLYQVETSGYFDVVASDLAFAGDRQAFFPAASAWLASVLPAAKQHPAIDLEGKGTPGPGQLPLSAAADLLASTPPGLPAPSGRILSERISPGGFSAVVDVAKASMVLLKATYHPNWRATVDGVQVGTAMLMPSLVGVQVPAGRHEVALTYRARPLRGLLLVLGLLVLVATGLTGRQWGALAGRLAKAAAPVVRHCGQGAGQAGKIQKSRTSSWSGASEFSQVLRHLPYLAAVALAALLAGLPLFQFRIMDGHDALEYLPRAVEFYEGLRAGQNLPRWAPDLSGGFGQPFFSFNPPVFYYAASAFRALGASFVAAQNLAIFALLLLAGLGMYLLAGAAYGRRGGLVSAVAYLLAPYLLAVLYVRHALADFSAFAFIPLALWGIYRFATAAPDPAEPAPPARRKPGRSAIYLVVASCATGLLMLSSNPVSLASVPALAAFAGWLALAGWLRGQGRFWPVLGRSLAGPLLGLGLSAFFWLPALLERDWIQVSRLLEGYLHYANHFVYPFQYLLSPWGYGLSLPGPVDGMSFALGPAHLLLGVVALALLPGLWRRAGWSGVLLAFFLFLSVSAAFMASTASAALWAWLPLLQYLEFPWRFLSLVAGATAFRGGAPLLFLERRGNRLLADGLMVLLIAGLMVLGLPRARPERFLEATDAGYTPGRIAAWNVPVTTAREYVPVWVQEQPTWSAGERLSFVEGQGLATAHAVAPVAYDYHVEVVDTARLRVNTFYFPGWTVYVDGEERSVAYDNRHGVMEFRLEAGDHWVQVRFEDTALRRWSTVLSLLAAGLLLVGALRAASRHPRKGSGH